MNSMPANPKQIHGAASLPLSLAPDSAVAYMALGLYEGWLKYGNVNFRAAPVEAMTYVHALKRHVSKWTEGEECDPVTGVPHLANALSCLAIIVDAKTHGSLIDNRPLSNAGYSALIGELTQKMRHLEQLHADKNPTHYYVDGPRKLKPEAVPAITTVVPREARPFDPASLGIAWAEPANPGWDVT